MLFISNQPDLLTHWLAGSLPQGPWSPCLLASYSVHKTRRLRQVAADDGGNFNGRSSPRRLPLITSENKDFRSLSLYLSKEAEKKQFQSINRNNCDKEKARRVWLLFCRDSIFSPKPQSRTGGGEKTVPFRGNRPRRKCLSSNFVEIHKQGISPDEGKRGGEGSKRGQVTRKTQVTYILTFLLFSVCALCAQSFLSDRGDWWSLWSRSLSRKSSKSPPP